MRHACWLTDGLFYTEKIIFPHFVGEREYAVSEHFEMLGDQMQHVIQPRVFHRGDVVRINPVVNIIVISLHKGAEEM